MWALLVCFNLGKERDNKNKKRGEGERDFVQIRKINNPNKQVKKLSSYPAYIHPSQKFIPITNKNIESDFYPNLI